MKVIDLFCGCGGFSLGFDYIHDFELVYALDNWDVSCRSYKTNFPYIDVDCRDALSIKPKEIPKADIIIGGPPCQEFTNIKAHSRGRFTPPARTFDTALIQWFMSIVEYVKPKFWIMENVPPVSKVVPTKIFRTILKMTDYGIPQLRKRMFAGKFNIPKKAPCKIRFPTVINEGGGVTYRPPNLGIRLGAVFRRRSLLTEIKLIQTFPLDYIIHGKLSERYKQLSNAVPPLMAYRLAEALINPQQKKIKGL